MNLGAKLFLNWLAILIGVALGIVLFRLQLSALGATALGTWVAISSVCGYLSLLELGLGSAINKYSAAHGARQDRAREERLLSTGLAIYAFLALLVLLGGAIGSQLLGPVLRVKAGLLRPGQLAMVLLSVNLAANFVLGVWRGVVFGRGRTDLIAILTISRHLLYATLVVVLLRRGSGFLGLAAAGILSDVSTGLVLVFFARARCQVRIALRLPDWAVARDLLRYSSSIILIVAGHQLLRSTALPLIQRYLGPEAVAAYMPADRLATLFFALIGQMGMVMVPPVASACAVDEGATQPALLRCGRLALSLGLPPLGVLLLFGDRLIAAWMGPAMAGSALYLRILGFALLAQLLAFGTDVGAYAIGGRRAYSISKLSGGFASVCVVYLGIRLGGAPGAAVGCALAIVLCEGLITPILVCRALRVSVRAHFLGLGRALPQALGLLGAAGLLLSLVRPGGVIATLLVSAAGCLAGWGLIYATYLRDEDRAFLRGRFQPIPPIRAPLKEGA